MPLPPLTQKIKDLGQQWVVHADTRHPIAPRYTIQHDEDGVDRVVCRVLSPGERVMMKCRMCRKLISFGHKSYVAFVRHCNTHHIHTEQDADEAMELLIQASHDGTEFPWVHWEVLHAPTFQHLDAMLVFVRKMEKFLEEVRARP